MPQTTQSAPGPPPSEVYRHGTTYYHPQLQQPPSRSPVRRPKAAIPIVNPQDHAGVGKQEMVAASSPEPAAELSPLSPRSPPPHGVDLERHLPEVKPMIINNQSQDSSDSSNEEDFDDADDNLGDDFQGEAEAQQEGQARPGMGAHTMPTPVGDGAGEDAPPMEPPVSSEPEPSLPCDPAPSVSAQHQAASSSSPPAELPSPPAAVELEGDRLSGDEAPPSSSTATSQPEHTAQGQGDAQVETAPGGVSSESAAETETGDRATPGVDSPPPDSGAPGTEAS